MGTMDNTARALRAQSSALWATVCCFVVGALGGVLILWGDARPLAGANSLAPRAALVSGVIAVVSFAVSSLVNRRGETARMPPWQRVISTVSGVAVGLAFAGITVLAVLLAAQILSIGLLGLEVGTFGGAAFTATAAAVAGRLAFATARDLRTSDLATLLFGFLIVGTLFAMLTAADPQWWQRNFSQLGSGVTAWAFNGTLVIAGLLIVAIGLYVGRDLHRLFGDEALVRVMVVVGCWCLTGAALAAVGLVPINVRPTAHGYIALAALALFVISAAITTFVLPRKLSALRATTIILVALVIASFVLGDLFDLFPVTALEVIVIGLALLWMSTLVRVLAVLAPSTGRVSQGAAPWRGIRLRGSASLRRRRR